MRSKPGYWYRQSAAIPMRKVNGAEEVLLVTSIKTGKWILPKGIVEPGYTPFDSAAKEAWEEAGVKGTVAEKPSGSYTARKWGGNCTVEAYVLSVNEEAADWLEAGKRQRRWFPLKEAAKKVSPPAAAHLLKELSLPKPTLMLFRHGKAERPSPEKTDFKRDLTKRGREDTRSVAEHIAGKALPKFTLYASTAKRAERTAKILTAALGTAKGEIVKVPEIYEAEVTELLALVRDLPKSCRAAGFVGHNPGLLELANLFLPEHLEKLPTAGAVIMEFPAASWRELEPGSATLIGFMTPKTLK